MSADDTQSTGWVSIVGVSWALDEAPCPVELLPTLIAIARRAGQDGRGSWQSPATIAKQVGRAAATVSEDIRRLRDEEGLISLGDQSIIPKWVRPGQRPFVYDLALDKKGPKKGKAPRNPGGKNAGGKAANQADTPGSGARGGSGTTPGLEATPTPGSRTRGTPGSETTPTPGSGTTQRRSEEDLEQQDLEEQDQSQPPLVLPVTDPERVDAGEERGEDPTDFAPDPEIEARRLAALYREHLDGQQVGFLRAHAIAALGRGWTFAGLAGLLAKELPHNPGNVGAILVARVRDCDEPPPPVDPNDDIPCPIGGHYDYDYEKDGERGRQYRALKCPACWSHVNVREDPFQGRHERRHPEWTKVYGFDPPAVEPDGLPDDPVDRADKLAAMLSAYLDASGIPADPECEGSEPVGVGGGESVVIAPLVESCYTGSSTSIGRSIPSGEPL